MGKGVPATLGGLVLWQLADAVLLALEAMHDGDGKRVNMFDV